MIELTGNIKVHHDRDMAQIWGQQRDTVNRLVQDQNNPDGEQ